MPQRHAGGAMAVTAYERFGDPVMVEFIQADVGIDICLLYTSRCV